MQNGAKAQLAVANQSARIDFDGFLAAINRTWLQLDRANDFVVDQHRDVRPLEDKCRRVRITQLQTGTRDNFVATNGNGEVDLVLDSTQSNRLLGADILERETALAAWQC